MYPRTVKVRSSSGSIHEYIRIVEAYREDGKVKQRVVADLGRKDLLIEILPKLRRLLVGDTDDEPGDPAALHVGEAATWGPVLVVRALFDQLGLWAILDQHLGKPRASPSPTAPSRWSPTGSSPRPVSMGWPAGSRPTSSATGRADASSPIGTAAAASASIPASSMPGTAPSTSSSGPRTASKWRCITASATSSASSPIWSSTTSPVPTSRGPGRPTSPRRPAATTLPAAQSLWV